MNNDAWPELPLERWRDTYATLHMWTQIVGKICLELTPRVNAYAAPEPPGFKSAKVGPAEALYDPDLSEFILPYDAVRSRPDPAATLLSFLQSTYEAGVRLAQWDRESLERSNATP